MAEIHGRQGDELADIMPPMPAMPTASPKAGPVVPPRTYSSEPVKGDPEREMETRSFRSDYFDGKTRAEVEALIEDSVRQGKTNPYFMRAGREALADLAALESKAVEDPIATAKVDGMAVEMADIAMEALRIAGKDRKKRAKRGESTEITIADQTIEDPERAYKNFVEAIDLVKKHVPSFLKVKVDEIKFQKLAGDIVGKSTEDGIIVDPIMLLHPVMRLATVIFHETLHASNVIQNEGLVQMQAEMYFGGVSNVKEYEDAVVKFAKFADIYGKGNIEKSAKAIYKLYYQAAKNGKQEDYMKIYDKFAKRARKTGYFADDTAIQKFFKEVFPELKMVEVKK